VLGLALTLAIKPTFTPEMDAFSYGWILSDMSQFETNARLLLGFVLAMVALGAWLRHIDPSRSAAALALAWVVFLIMPLGEFWKSAPSRANSPFPQERGPDPVVPLLAQLDPAHSVIAAEHMNWNGENPHWAAFFGHQFVQLRRGRWATAVPGFEQTVRDQSRLFTTDSREEAIRILRERGVTHLVASAEQPVPWLVGTAPTSSNATYAVYDVQPFLR